MRSLKGFSVANIGKGMCSKSLYCKKRNIYKTLSYLVGHELYFKSVLRHTTRYAAASIIKHVYG